MSQFDLLFHSVNAGFVNESGECLGGLIEKNYQEQVCNTYICGLFLAFAAGNGANVVFKQLVLLVYCNFVLFQFMFYNVLCVIV